MTVINILLLIAIWNLLMSIINKQKTNLLYCGLIGFSGKTNFDKNKINTLMLWNSLERGKDSTGIYSPKNGVIKNADAGAKFLLSTPFEEDNLLIAHVRAKTVGAATIANAHPFLEDKVVLAHNGTLKNHWGLSRKYNLDYQKYDVDSHIMCAIMSKENNFKVLSEIEGAAAVLISNIDNPNILYAYRNGERPLFKGHVDGGMYISSIKESLELIGCKNVKEFKENYLYTIIDGLIQGTPKKIVNKPCVHVYNTQSSGKYVGINSPKGPDLIGCMLRMDHFANPPSNGLTFDKYYKVVGHTTNYACLIINDFDKEVEVETWKFAVTLDYFSIGDYVKARELLTYRKDNKVACNRGDICLVQEDDKKGVVLVLNLTRNETVSVEKYLLKRLTAQEQAEYNTVINNDIVLNNEDVNIMFPEGGFSTTPNYYNRDTDPEQEEYQEDQNGDSRDYFDMEVNEEKLVNDFQNISIASKDLIELVKGFIPEDKLEEFKSKKMELEECISDALNEYHITTNI